MKFFINPTVDVSSESPGDFRFHSMCVCALKNSKMNYFSFVNFFAFIILILNLKYYFCNPTGTVSKDLKKARHEYHEKVCDGKLICNTTVRVLPEKGFYKCMCDSDCQIYGDCCSDSPYHNQTTRNLSTSNRTRLSFICSKQFEFYMVNMCPPQFANASLKNLCENVTVADRYENVKTLKPVMDRKTRITYSNAYCAFCNGVVDFELFELSFSCSGAKTFEYVQDFDHFANVLVGATFNTETKRLTSTYNGTEYICSHKVIVPPLLKPHTRYCEPKLISSCPATYNNSSIIEKCLHLNYAMYTSFFTGVDDVYKNEFCAICNGVRNTTNLYHCQMGKEITRTGASSLWGNYYQSSKICDDVRLKRFC